MLEVSAKTSVCGHCCPLIAQHSRLRLAVIHHRFNREHHSLAQPGAMSAIPEVGNLWLFMQPRPDAVSNELAYDTESGGFYMLLHGCADVADRIPDSRLLNSAIQRSLGNFQQFLQLRLQPVSN